MTEPAPATPVRRRHAAELAPATHPDARRPRPRGRAPQRVVAGVSLLLIAAAPVLARSASGLGLHDAVAAELAAVPGQAENTLEELQQGGALAGTTSAGRIPSAAAPTRSAPSGTPLDVPTVPEVTGSATSTATQPEAAAEPEAAADEPVGTPWETATASRAPDTTPSGTAPLTSAPPSSTEPPVTSAPGNDDGGDDDAQPTETSAPPSTTGQTATPTSTPPTSTPPTSTAPTSTAPGSTPPSSTAPSSTGRPSDGPDDDIVAMVRALLLGSLAG